MIAQQLHSHYEMDMTKNVAIVLAAGSGSRAGGGLAKQWHMLEGVRVIDWPVAQFRAHPNIDRVIITYDPADADHITAFADDVTCIAGGATRRQSVYNALAHINAQGDAPQNVLIHDGARPCIKEDLIDRCINALKDAPACAPGLEITDALWSVEEDQIKRPQSRDGLFRAQTPQAFCFADIWAIYNADIDHADDDVQMALQQGMNVRVIAGDESNIKITRPADFDRAAQILRENMDIRLGNGCDVHKFTPENQKADHVILCGLKIPHGRALSGHSDADVALHAITDAIYGALAEGDIGTHFPPSEAQWKGADSAIFLKHAVQLAKTRGYAISNIDCTLVCEAPKISPHAQDMRENVAHIMGIEVGRVSIKATTSERLGFTGRREGITCLATAALTGA